MIVVRRNICWKFVGRFCFFISILLPSIQSTSQQQLKANGNGNGSNPIQSWNERNQLNSSSINVFCKFNKSINQCFFLNRFDFFKFLIAILNLFGYNVNYTDSPKCPSLTSSLDQQNLTMNSEISTFNFRSFIIEEVDRFQCITKAQMESTKDGDNYSIEQAFGYGTLAIVLISILPIILFFFIPSDKKWYYPYVMNTLM